MTYRRTQTIKIFSKVLTLRLGKILDRLISSNQSAFIQGRYILESVVVAHELVYSVHSSKELGVLLKLDYEKAYDRVNWDFCWKSLALGVLIPSRLGGLKVVLNGSVGVCLNGEESHSFKPGKGLRQGDPLAPLLFNLVSDVLSTMLIKGASRGLIRGLATDFREEGILALQYADGTIIFSDVDFQHL